MNKGLTDNQMNKIQEKKNNNLVNFCCIALVSWSFAFCDPPSDPEVKQIVKREDSSDCLDSFKGIWQLDSVELYKDNNRMITSLVSHNTDSILKGVRYAKKASPYRIIAIPKLEDSVYHYFLGCTVSEEYDLFSCDSVEGTNLSIRYYSEFIRVYSDDSIELEPKPKNYRYKKMELSSNCTVKLEYTLTMAGNVADLHIEYYSKIGEGSKRVDAKNFIKKHFE